MGFCQAQGYLTWAKCELIASAVTSGGTGTHGPGHGAAMCMGVCSAPKRLAYKCQNLPAWN